MQGRPRRAMVGFAFLWATSACSQVSYLGHVGYHEARILLAREPIEEVLRESGAGEEEKQKLRLVLSAKQFALDIGLARTGNFGSFVRLDRDWTSLGLTAAPSNSLEPYRWHFPIVGWMPYKGFFDPERAKEEKGRLEAEGYETYLRKVVAFSTLGWFDDPVLSPMLRMDALDLVDTIIHETVHATVFLKSEVEFNESLATFVGEGSLAFLRREFGEGAPELADACASAADEQRFSSFLASLVEELTELFQRETSRDEKLRGKQEIYERRKQELRDERALYHSDRFARFADVQWNNAMIASFRGYRTNLDLFQALYAREGYDLPRTISLLKELSRKSKASPFEALRAEIGGGPSPIAGPGRHPCSPEPKAEEASSG
jgi:predicted aminopeptidase